MEKLENMDRFRVANYANAKGIWREKGHYEAINGFEFGTIFWFYI